MTQVCMTCGGAGFHQPWCPNSAKITAVSETYPRWIVNTPTLSRRDEFAKAARQKIMQRQLQYESQLEVRHYPAIAVKAYAMADAMIAESGKK